MGNRTLDIRHDAPEMPPMQLLVLLSLLVCRSVWALDVAWWEGVRQEISPSATQVVPLVDLDAVCDPVGGSVVGTMRALISNPLKKPLRDLGFNLYANNANSSVGTSLKILSAEVGGFVVVPQLVADGRGLVLALSEPLPPGSATEVSIKFHTILAKEGGRVGLLSVNRDATTFYNWYPELAVVRPDGWRFDEISQITDPNYVRVVDARCHLRLPLDWTLVASGTETNMSDGSWLIRAPKVRNLVAWMSKNSLSFSATRGNLRIRLFGIGSKIPEAELLAQLGLQTLSIASEVFGPYAQTGETGEFDVVFQFLEGFGGVEASAMTFLHRPYFDLLDHRRKDPLRETEVAESLIHEILHSWWMGQVGNDTCRDAWLDEPLTQWCTWYLMERIWGRKTAVASMLHRLDLLPYLENRFVPLTSSSEFLGQAQYGILLYTYAPMMYEDLRQRLGTEVFLKVVRSWRDKHLYQEVSRVDWEETFLGLLPAADRDDFRDTWLDGMTLHHKKFDKLMDALRRE